MSKQVLTVTSELTNLEPICRFVSGAASNMGMDNDTIYDLQLAVDEACTNIVEHAYQGENKGEIECSCDFDQVSLTIIIRDHGRPFDPSIVSEPVLDAPAGDH